MNEPASHLASLPSRESGADVVRRLAGDLAANAERHDRDGTFVADSYSLLRQHRLFSMAVPAELGGGGAGFGALCDTVFELGRHCGSTALAFSMHSHLVAATVWKHRHGKPGEALLRKVADGERVLLSTGASDWVDSNGTMVAVDGGYRVSARKVFGSGSPAADVIIASARLETEQGVEVLHFPVPTSAEGVTIGDDWDTLGMRGTGSHTVTFDDVFVPAAAIALRRPAGQWHPAWNVVLTVALPVIMSAYAGIASAAAERALAMAGRRGGATSSAGALVNLATQTDLAWRALVDNAAEYEFQPTLDRANRALVAKTLCANAAIATVHAAVRVAGGRAFFRSLPLERMLRDVQAADFHPLPEDRQRDFSGRLALGRDPITDEPIAAPVLPFSTGAITPS